MCNDNISLLISFPPPLCWRNYGGCQRTKQIKQSPNIKKWVRNPVVWLFYLTETAIMNSFTAQTLRKIRFRTMENT